mmetsp:Transcript_21052/g.32123  ORF Transcript_21052/g.32123 Transcript_21052/m.32123 type:complete len:286 (+) Transcript_21052:354-1211(+)
MSNMHTARNTVTRRFMQTFAQHSRRENTANQMITKRSSASTNTRNKIPFYGLPRPEKQPENNDISPPPLKRLVVAATSAVTALVNPERADAVAALGEVTGTISLQQMYDRMMQDSIGQTILRDKPKVDGASINLDVLLETSGSGSFGEAYAKFMMQHGFDPEERSAVRYIADPELAYVMLRYRQSHDFWHVLCDLPPTVLGELALKWVELVQTGLPVAALSATFGPLQLSANDRDVLRTIYLPWALRVGQRAPFLMNVYYEELFQENLDDLRERLMIEPAPKIKS